MGDPQQVYEPNYECGFLLSEEQGKNFTTLAYSNIKFTGNEEDNYFLEEIVFKDNPSVFVEYDGQKLDSSTDLTTLEKIFGKIFGKEYFQNISKEQDTGVLILGKNGEDGIRLEIKMEKLVALHYWSPC